MPAAALIAVAAVAAGSEGYNAYQASKDRDEMQNERGRQEAMAKEQQDKMKAETDKATSDAAAVTAESDRQDQLNATRLAQQRRRSGFGSALGTTQGGTILTGPRGLGSSPNTSAPKTLLGE